MNNLSVNIQKATALFPWKWIVSLHVVFLAYALTVGHTRTRDSQEYLIQSQNIRAHGSVYCGDLSAEIKPELISRRPPGYGSALAAFSWYSKPEYFVLPLQMLLSIVNLFVVFVILQVIGIELQKKSGWLIVPLLFFPSQMIYSNMIMSEVWLQSCFTGMTLFMLLWMNTRVTKWMVYFQLTLIAALLIKPVAYPIAMVMLVITALRYLGGKASANDFLSSFMPMIVIGFIIGQHYSSTGVAEFSSIQRDVKINYDMPKLLHRRMSDANAIDSVVAIEAKAALLDYPQRCALIDSATNVWVKADPNGYSLVRLKGIARFFLDAGRWDWEAFTQGWELAGHPLQQKGSTTYYFTLLMLIVGTLSNLLLLVGMIILLTRKEISLEKRLALVALIFFVALLTGASGTARFRVPVFPLQLVCLAVGFSKISSIHFFSLQRRRDTEKSVR